MLNRRQALFLTAATPLALATSPLAFAQSETAYYNKGGIAIGGSDAVAYFTVGEPTMGVPTVTHDWGGVSWQFASEESRDLFAANPEAYAPQYGGYCAWAVARGYLAPTIPEAWNIVDGKLYLNATLRIQRRWERDIPGFLAQAEENWPALKAQ